MPLISNTQIWTPDGYALFPAGKIRGYVFFMFGFVLTDSTAKGAVERFAEEDAQCTGAFVCDLFIE